MQVIANELLARCRLSTRSEILSRRAFVAVRVSGLELSSYEGGAAWWFDSQPRESLCEPGISDRDIEIRRRSFVV